MRAAAALRCAFAAALLLVLAAPASAQLLAPNAAPSAETPAAAPALPVPSETPPPPPAAIALSDIAASAESTVQRLRAIEVESAPGPRIQAISEALPERSEAIDKGVSSVSEAIATRAGLDRLLDLDHKLAAVSEEVELWQTQTKERAARLDARVTELAAMKETWDLTLDNAKGMADLSERMTQFMLKAVREAKAHTSWTGQNAEYEEAIESFTRAALDPAGAQSFLRDFVAACEPVFLAGALNSLSQTAIKLTAPGVPDIYQGTELWDLSLVDPDNRRHVDFDQRQLLQKKIDELATDALLADWRSGAIKMRLLQAGLRLRSSAKE